MTVISLRWCSFDSAISQIWPLQSKWFSSWLDDEAEVLGVVAELKHFVLIGDVFTFELIGDTETVKFLLSSELTFFSL